MKSYETGNFIIKNINKQSKKDIKVRQIYPDGQNNLNNLYLNSNEKFKAFLNDNKITDNYENTCRK